MEPKMPSKSTSTLGEAIVAGIALIGFLTLWQQGTLNSGDIWKYAAVLAMISVFYFTLLFARMMFFWMTGGDGVVWWDKYIEAKRIEKQK
jgi:hypothetical protein